MSATTAPSERKAVKSAHPTLSVSPSPLALSRQSGDASASLAAALEWPSPTLAVAAAFPLGSGEAAVARASAGRSTALANTSHATSEARRDGFTESPDRKNPHAELAFHLDQLAVRDPLPVDGQLDGLARAAVQLHHLPEVKRQDLVRSH